MLDVIDRCYAGVLDDGAWQGALTALADLVGGSGAVLFAIHPVTHAVTRFDVARFDSEVMATYAAHWVALDVRVAPALLAANGAPQTEEMLLPRSALRRSAIYNDFLKRADCPHVLATWLHRTLDRAVNLAIEGTRQRGPFTAAERERLAAVLPHVTRAIELKDRLALGTGVSTSLLAVADSLPIGVLIVDAQSRILQASKLGGRILASGDGLFTVGNRLAFRRRVDEKAFLQLLAAALGDPVAHSLTIPRQHSPVSLSVWVAPVRSRTEPWMTAVQQWVVAIEDPSERSAPMPEVVAREWHVTPAESRVVCLLAGGASVPQIAATLHVSEHTVRSQLKSVYGKTGMTSQLEVVRRLLSHAIGPSH
jgi:DNA-binding CsgD family transcriptional regulator/PAS domain-containing protein